MSTQNERQHISSRELQILHLAAEGRTDKEIAALLGISRDTVGTYWKRIRHRLGGSSRTEAVARALRQEASAALNEFVIENERLLYEMAERNRAEEERARLVVRLETLIDGVHSGVLLEDEDRTIIYLNRAMCEMMGFEPEEGSLVGTSGAECAARMAPLFLPESHFHERTCRIVADGERVQGEVLRMANGDVLERDYTPLRSRRGLDGHLWQYRDITALQKAMDALETKSAFDDLIAMLSTQVLSCLPESLDDTIAQALEAVGRHLKADRVYVLMLSQDDKVFSIAYEWLSPGVSSTFPHFSHIEADQQGAATEMLKAGKHIAVSSVADQEGISPDALRLLKETGTQSILVIPLMFEGRTQGCISFAHVHGTRQWTDAEIALLRLVAVTIGHALSRAHRLGS